VAALRAKGPAMSARSMTVQGGVDRRYRVRGGERTAVPPIEEKGRLRKTGSMGDNLFADTLNAC